MKSIYLLVFVIFIFVGVVYANEFFTVKNNIIIDNNNTAGTAEYIYTTPNENLIQDELEITFGEILLNKSTYYHLSCDSRSMYPVFTCEDNLTVVNVENKYSLRVGDIIWYSIPLEVKREVYSSKISYLVHRIIDVQRKQIITCSTQDSCIIENQVLYTTKGDNNTQEDSILVYPYQIKFKVIKVNGVVV